MLVSLTSCFSRTFSASFSADMHWSPNSPFWKKRTMFRYFCSPFRKDGRGMVVSNAPVSGDTPRRMFELIPRRMFKPISVACALPIALLVCLPCRSTVANRTAFELPAWPHPEHTSIPSWTCWTCSIRIPPPTHVSAVCLPRKSQGSPATSI